MTSFDPHAPRREKDMPGRWRVRLPNGVEIPCDNMREAGDLAHGDLLLGTDGLEGAVVERLLDDGRWVTLRGADSFKVERGEINWESEW